MLSTVLTTFTLVTSVFAGCNFNLRVEHSSNTDLNGLTIQSLNNVATTTGPFTNILAHFPTDSTVSSPLLVTGVPGDGNGNFILEPVSDGVQRVVFGAPPEEGSGSLNRWTEWTILADGTLTYGSEADRFMIWSPPSPIAHYEVYWVPAGVAWGGWAVDLVPEFTDCSA